MTQVRFLAKKKQPDGERGLYEDKSTAESGGEAETFGLMVQNKQNRWKAVKQIRERDLADVSDKGSKTTAN